MNGLNKQFMANVHGFMSVNAINIDTGSRLNGLGESGVYSFDLAHSQFGGVILRLMDERGKPAGRFTHAIRAYWLPWAEGETTQLPLGREADFFFTSGLGGCRVQIAGTNARPHVLHIAGNTGVPWRDEESIRHAGTLARSFSQTKHYGGPRGEDCGFVAGYRDTASGEWKFVAQAHAFNAGTKRISIGRIYGRSSGVMTL